MRQRAYRLFCWLIENYLEKKYLFENKIYSMNKLINYSYISKQETELLIPAQTGNRTIKMYTSTERILSVDHWPPKRKDMQLIIDLIILLILRLIEFGHWRPKSCQSYIRSVSFGIYKSLKIGIPIWEAQLYRLGFDETLRMSGCVFIQCRTMIMGATLGTW